MWGLKFGADEVIWGLKFRGTKYASLGFRGRTDYLGSDFSKLDFTKKIGWTADYLGSLKKLI